LRQSELRTKKSAITLLALPHLFDKLVKQVIGVMGSGISLGMVLHRKNRQLPVPQAFNRVVVQIDMGNLHVRITDRIHIHTESMILGSNFHLACGKILNGMV
jgi:hypothetical protein